MLAAAPNPTLIPLPPSRVESPLDVGPNPQRTSYFTTSVSENYKQRHSRMGEASDAKNSSEYGDQRTSAIDNRSSHRATTIVGNRDSNYAGRAANIAVRSYRPMEAASPKITTPAAHVAAMASKEARIVHNMEHTESGSFANSAAVLAQKATGEAGTVTGIVIHPHSQSFRHNAIVNDDEPPSTHDVAADIHNAAAKAMPKAPLAATARPPHRRVLSANLEEAARKAAARRLALLDQELYESGAIRRLPLPDYDRETRQSASPRRSYSMRDGATMRSQKQTDEDVYANLLDVARRNVENKLAGIDLEVANKKGFVYRKEREDRAMRHMEARSRGASLSERNGKIDVGGGRFVDAEAVERIAMRNVQPVLDEITARAAAERARIAAERAEAEEKKRLENFEKERNREIKAENKRVKAAEKSEIARQKSKAKQQNRVSKPNTQGTGGTVGTDNNAREAACSHGITEPMITREKPTSPPPQESRSKLRKFIGKLRRSMTPPSAGSEGGRFIGGATYAQEKEREKERGARGATPGGRGGEEVGGNLDRGMHSTVGGTVGDLPPHQSTIPVASRPPATTTEPRQDIESGEVFWDRVEFTDPEEFSKRQTEENADRFKRLDVTPTVHNTRAPTLARRSVDGLAAATSGSESVYHPLRQTMSLPATTHGGTDFEPDSSEVSKGAFSVSTPGYPRLHYPPNTEPTDRTILMAIQNDGPAAESTNIRDSTGMAERSIILNVSGVRKEEGEERHSIVPFYDHPIHPIDVTVIRTVGQPQERTRLPYEAVTRDMYGDNQDVPDSRVKSGKSVRIEGLTPQVSYTEEQAVSVMSQKAPKESRFREDL